MKTSMCRHCELDQTCKKLEDYPKISPLSAWLIKWHYEIEAGFAIYPRGGSWENQPQWFIDGISLVRATVAKVQKELSEKESRKRGRL
jgi:hypothetical protein